MASVDLGEIDVLICKIILLAILRTSRLPQVPAVNLILEEFLTMKFMKPLPRGHHVISPPSSSDPWLYRMITGALSLTVLTCAGGVVILQLNGKPTPDVLSHLGTVALGALTGVLVPSPKRLEE